MNLDQLISKLKGIDPSLNVVLRIKYYEDNIKKTTLYYPKKKVYYAHDIEEYPKFFHSYRGYYREIAISISPKDKGYTVSELLTAATKSIGFSFVGYHGGSYKMDLTTPVWASRYGSASSLQCMDIIVEENIAYIELAKKEKE